jgi:hypothetical protein
MLDTRRGHRFDCEHPLVCQWVRLMPYAAGNGGIIPQSHCCNLHFRYDRGMSFRGNERLSVLVHLS